MGVSTDLIALLRYLLPGFLAAWVFYGFTAHEKTSQFERVVQAVIFTVVVQAVLGAASVFSPGLAKAVGETALGSSTDFVLAVTAVATGLVFALFANRDWLHGLLRWMHVTQQTSYPSEWYGAFSRERTFVVLHFNDGRRLYGWPAEWPRSSQGGHFVLEAASCLATESDGEIADTEGSDFRLDAHGVKSILVSTSDIRWVEFMVKEMRSDG